MFNFLKNLDKDPKKQKAAAYEMDSVNEMSPPDFNMTSQNAGSSQPIQGMFPSSTKMGGQTTSFPDVSKTPSPAGPVPIPYPNIGTATSDKITSKHVGIKGSMSTGMQGLTQGMQGFSQGMQNLGSKAAHKITGASKSFSGNGSDYVNAVKFGKQMFKLQAKFKNLTIMGVSAIGTPGCLDGPNINSLIKNAPSVAGMQGDDKSMRDAVAGGVSENFESWRKNVMVPGLPWYPSFAAWPGPMAPPMPNVPMPLMSCVSSKMNKITVASELKKAIYSKLPGSMKSPETEAFVMGIAIQLSIHFLIWLASQQVMNVLGKGPVPSFAPPFVPVGPVVNGDNIAVPGHLAA